MIENKKLESIANILYFSYHENLKIAHDVYEGYNVILIPCNKKQYKLVFGLSRDNRAPIESEMQYAIQGNSAITSCTVERNEVIYTITPNSNKADAIAMTIRDALDQIVSSLKAEGYENACSYCGTKESEISIYNITGHQTSICHECYKNNLANKVYANDKKENVLKGILGAFLGALLGGVVVVFFLSMGSISFVGGILLSLASLAGYQMLAGKLSYKGIIISSIFILLTCYIAINIDAALQFSEFKEYRDENIFSLFMRVPELLKGRNVNIDAYYENLLYVVAFSAVGIVISAIQIIKNQKDEKWSRKLS
ncbi:MAG: hypothetical protein K2L08_01720 [Erysipelotrichaceae bacterium]|nr:hypothetical protein [Erysipelotrichaceae bacterium]